jgi:type VI secretion system protein ImpE
MALLLEALRLDADGKHEKAQSLRAEAFEAAPTTAGKINGEINGETSGETGGQAFTWIADADSRLGPMLEAVVNGRYSWIPFARLRKIKIEKPVDLRDMVWTPVQLTLANGGEMVALVPTRYPGSEKASDTKLALARSTEWTQPVPETSFGSGQRIIATDVGEHPLLDIREIELEGTAGDDPAAGGDDSQRT